MATTTNFGWETPDDTDLVKDGAAAMRTLGNAIDTSLVDLKGGTTGQILSKASNTDLDYTWINNDQGDITEVTAGTGLTGGGTSGAVSLAFDVANYGGGQWAAGKNKIINGDFRINQRSFSNTTTSATYGFDRWRYACAGGTATYSAQTFTAGTAPVSGYEAINFARLVTASQSAAGDFAILQQFIESVRTFAGQTINISFWAKASTGTPKIAVELVQAFGTGGSPSADVNTYAGQTTLSTSWARYSLSVAIPSISGKTLGTTNDGSLGLFLWTSAGTNFNSRTGSLGIQNATIDFWGVQVEAGSVATAFQTATGTIQGELAACQRYYQRVNTIGNTYAIMASGMANSTTQTLMYVPLKTVMRTTPSSIGYGGTLKVSDGPSISSVTSMAIDTALSDESYLGFFVNASSLTQFRPYILRGDNSASAYLEMNAEL